MRHHLRRPTPGPSRLAGCVNPMVTAFLVVAVPLVVLPSTAAAGSDGATTRWNVGRHPERAATATFTNSTLGKLRLGMTGPQAVKTGWVAKIPREDDWCKDRYAMRKPYAKHGFLVGGRTHGAWRITVLATRSGDPEYRMRNSAGVDSTFEELESLYGTNLGAPVSDRYEPSFTWTRVRTKAGYVNFLFDAGIDEVDGDTPAVWMGISSKKTWGLGGC